MASLNEDQLNQAVRERIISQDQLEALVRLATSSTVTNADEEAFRLVNSFNDIFVVIACGLLFGSIYWLLPGGLDHLVIAASAWGLAEIFVKKRNMALPAIVLLLAFVGSIFWLTSSLVVYFVFGGVIDRFPSIEELQWGFAVSGVLAAVAAWLHWRRFRVPITLAGGVFVLVVGVLSSLVALYEDDPSITLSMAFICGLAVFYLAMRWDKSDRERLTYRSDVAFWLHLLATPLVVHPVFSFLGVFDGESGLSSLMFVVFLYLLIMWVSLLIDRRALMVSSLIYVIHASSVLLDTVSELPVNTAVTGVLIASALLLLSAWWQQARILVLSRCPHMLHAWVPTSTKV